MEALTPELRLVLDSLSGSCAYFVTPEDDDDTTVTLDRTQWETLGRPGTLTLAPEAPF